MAEKYGKSLEKTKTKKLFDNRKEQILTDDEIIKERAKNLTVLNERLKNEVGPKFRCILNDKKYFNIMYKGVDLKINIKQNEGVINLAKHIKSILDFIKENGLEGNDISSERKYIKNPDTKEIELTSAHNIYIGKYAGFLKELLTDSDKILIASGYSKRPGLSEKNGQIDGYGINAEDLARSNDTVTYLMTEFLDKINDMK